LLAKEVAKRREVLERQRVGRGSYLPLFLFFVLLFIVTSQGFGLRGSILPRSLVAARVTLQPRLLCLRTRSYSLWTQFTSHLAASSGKVTPTG
jgi:hypothetical protein